ncbi:MAG: endonuclease domain-containing protein [Calditrichaeota bacterium]|nr:endonuclease domain-containing protein [Calditrichota bacterium]
MARNKIIPYDPKLRQIARKLRKQGTLGEIFLWRRIRGKQIRGYEFHRQVPLDRYIVDFYCHELMLAIEIDGGSHFYKVDQDQERQVRLERLGVHFLRFTEMEVRKNIEDALNVIDAWIAEYERNSA